MRAPLLDANHHAALGWARTVIAEEIPERGSLFDWIAGEENERARQYLHILDDAIAILSRHDAPVEATP